VKKLRPKAEETGEIEAARDIKREIFRMPPRWRTQKMHQCIGFSHNISGTL
jgi:hypothetical protein